jgi:hypothetical protein
MIIRHVVCWHKAHMALMIFRECAGFLEMAARGAAGHCHDRRRPPPARPIFRPRIMPGQNWQFAKRPIDDRKRLGRNK